MMNTRMISFLAIPCACAAGLAGILVDASAQLNRPGTTRTSPGPVPAAVSGDVMAAVAVQSPVNGGWETTMTVKLSRGAPETNPDRRCRGIFVSLQSSHPAVTALPSNVCVQTGETTASVTVRTNAVATDTSVTLSARYLDFPARTATLVVATPAVDHLSLSAPTIAGGMPVAGAVHFTGPPPGGAAIVAYLQSNNPNAATVPPTVTLPANATAAPFQVVTHGVSTNTQVRISASRNPPNTSSQPTAVALGTGGRSIELGIIAAKLDGLFVGLNATTMPNTFFLIARLDGPAPKGGATVQLTSQRPDVAAVPPSMTVAEGQAEGRTNIARSAPPANEVEVRITGTYSGVSKSTQFGVQRPDIVVRRIVVKDVYGNVVTTAQDSQALTVCADVSVCGRYEDVVTSCGAVFAPPPPTFAVRYTYRKYDPATQTSTSRSNDVAASLMQGQSPTVCAAVPGVEEHGWLEIDVAADAANQIPEWSESNNGATARITRP